jgi:N-acetyl-gamma-glutamyl-phosphate reductase
MSAKIFIDGQAGTTGLGIAQRLAAMPGIALVTLGEAQRKDAAARQDAMAQADLTVLCLPDEAAREAVALAPEGTRILDASSAHRTAPGWIFGFPELGPAQAQNIAQARLVSNPGCHASGAIALLNPLVEAGLLRPDHDVTIHSVSGYSGGGKAMIAAHEAEGGPAFEAYALGLAHKHVPEIMRHSGLTRRPIFMPSVGHFAQGMLVSIPLFLDRLPGKPAGLDLVAAYRQRYDGTENILVHPEIYADRLRPEALNGTSRLEIFVCANGAYDHAMVVARLDNLGKGASGAAVQNIKLMLGDATDYA